MQGSHHNLYLVLALSLILILSTACSSAAQTPVVPPAATEAQPAPATIQAASPTAAAAAAASATVTATTAAATEAAAAAPTATAEPTLTPTAEVVQPTPTITAEAPLSAEGVQGWCLPPDATVAMTADPLNPPGFALVGQAGPDGLEIRNLPAYACVFTYTLSGPAPDGLELQVFEMSASKPWLTTALTPVEGSPNTVSAVLRHTYIIAPPLWDWSYQFALVDVRSGTELRRDTVNMHRWEPKLCWNQRKPNVITLRCPLAQDQHPWDPWYGKPMPTGVPEEK